jgi:hypothetical protein
MSENTKLPQVITGEAPYLGLDAAALADVMQTEYGISPETLANTTVVIDDKNRLSYKASQVPKKLDRLVRGPSESNQGDGSVVRVGSRFRGKDRTPDEMNHALAHELEHVAQMDRKDRKVTVGNILIWGGAVVGAALGYGLTRNRPGIGRIAGPVAGAAVGQKLGYTLAPYERQARVKAENTHLELITGTK